MFQLGEKPYPCPHCPKAFRQRGDREKHVRARHKFLPPQNLMNDDTTPSSYDQQVRKRQPKKKMIEKTSVSKYSRAKSNISKESQLSMANTSTRDHKKLRNKANTTDPSTDTFKSTKRSRRQPLAYVDSVKDV